MVDVTQQEKHRFCFVVRHGERSDEVGETSQADEHDPALTPQGLEKATKTAKYLT